MRRDMLLLLLLLRLLAALHGQRETRVGSGVLEQRENGFESGAAAVDAVHFDEQVAASQSADARRRLLVHALDVARAVAGDGAAQRRHVRGGG